MPHDTDGQVVHVELKDPRVVRAMRVLVGDLPQSWFRDELAAALDKVERVHVNRGCRLYRWLWFAVVALDETDAGQKLHDGLNVWHKDADKFAYWANDELETQYDSVPRSDTDPEPDPIELYLHLVPPGEVIAVDADQLPSRLTWMDDDLHACGAGVDVRMRASDWASVLPRGHLLVLEEV